MWRSGLGELDNKAVSIEREKKTFEEQKREKETNNRCCRGANGKNKETKRVLLEEEFASPELEVALYPDEHDQGGIELPSHEREGEPRHEAGRGIISSS